MAATPRQRNQPGNGNRLREELIEAASRVLAAAPDGVLSLRAVAREAGIAAPSVYLQFADKAELVAAVLHDHFDQLRFCIIAAMAGITDPPARLRAGCMAYCRFGLERPGPYRILFEVKPVTGQELDRPGGGDDPGAQAFATLVTAIQDCITAGIAPAADPFRTAAAVWSGLHGYVTLVRARRTFPWQSAAEHVEDLVVGLVGVPRQLPAPDAGADASPRGHGEPGDRPDVAATVHPDTTATRR